MKNMLTKFIFSLLFLAGLSLLLYPFVSNKWNDYRQGELISVYEETVSRQNMTGAIDYEKEWERAEQYNDSLKPYILPDSFAAAADTEEPDGEYMACLNLTGDGMMGYVEVPKIGVKLPVYHTTDASVLQVAAGHLAGSSLPVGGAGNHAVISAHRGLPSAALFTDLDQLQEGDVFFLYILDEALCYQVDRISVVEPEDTADLMAVDDMDLVTLLTCTPYGVNSHRLLVRGERVDYEELENQVMNLAHFSGPSLRTNYGLWAVIGLAVTGMFIFAMYLYDERRKKVPGKGAMKSRKASKPETAKESGHMQDRESQAGNGAAKSIDTEAPENPAVKEWRDDWPEGEPEGWRDDWPEERNETETD